MAKPTTVKFREFLIYVGDGGSPETFSKPCGLTSRGINFQANTQSTTVPDCDDDSPSWEERDISSRQADISGAGTMALEFFDAWWEWFDSGESRNVQVRLADRGYWQGPAVLTGLNMSGEEGNKVQVDISIEFDGKVEWHQGAAA